MNTPPAIAVIEFDSIAVGTRVADAMVKRAPLDLFRIGTVHPGKYLILVGGAVAAVDESRNEGLRLGEGRITDEIFLPDVHEQVYSAVAGHRRDNAGDALGILETSAIPINVAAADKAVKTADVTIVEIRLGDGLGGKAVTLMTGLIHDVQAALEAAVALVESRSGTHSEKPGATFFHTIIPIQHADLRTSIRHATEFYPAHGAPPPPAAPAAEKPDDRTPPKRPGRS